MALLRGSEASVDEAWGLFAVHRASFSTLKRQFERELGCKKGQAVASASLQEWQVGTDNQADERDEST